MIVYRLSSWLWFCLALAGCYSVEEQANTLFIEHPETSSRLTFSNTLQPTEQLNIITYLYYYNGSGIGAGDFDEDGDIDLYFGANQLPDAVYLNEGYLSFRQNEASGIGQDSSWTSGVSVADINGDGHLDIYVCRVAGVAGLDGRNELYLGDGAGSFRESARELGLDFSGLSTQAAFFDADADGDLDCYLLNHSTHSTSRRTSIAERTVRDSLAGDRFYLQQPDGTFDDATTSSGIYSSRLGYGLSLAIGDFDEDGLPDVYVANDFDENDYLYRNLGEGRFQELGQHAFAYNAHFSMGCALGDLDNNGHLDLMTVDMRPPSDSIRKSSAGGAMPKVFARRVEEGFSPQYARNMVQLGKGDGRFQETAALLGLHSTDWSWSPVIFDADLDGNMDVFVANGITRRPNDLDYLKFASGRGIQRGASNLELAELMPPGQAPNEAFRGQESGTFSPVAASWGVNHSGSSTSALALDLDNDGDLDLVSSQVNEPILLLENTAAVSPKSSTTVRLLNPSGAPLSDSHTVLAEQGDWRQAYSTAPIRGFQSSAVAALNISPPNPGSFTLTVNPYASNSRQMSFTISTDTSIHILSAKHLRESEGPWLEPATADHEIARYELFDSEPLLPIRRTFDDAEDQSSWSLNTVGAATESQIQISAKGRILQLPSEVTIGVDAWLYPLSDSVALLGSMWAPIYTVERSGDESDRLLSVHQLAPSGLWLGATAVELADGREKIVLTNAGLNTLLTEQVGDTLELHLADFDRNGKIDPIVVRIHDGVRQTLFGLDEIAVQMPAVRKFFTSYLPYSASTFSDLFPPVGEGGRILSVAELRNALFDVEARSLSYLPNRVQLGPIRRLSLTDDEPSGGVEAHYGGAVFHPQIGGYPGRPVEFSSSEIMEIQIPKDY